MKPWDEYKRIAGAFVESTSSSIVSAPSDDRYAKLDNRSGSLSPCFLYSGEMPIIPIMPVVGPSPPLI